ncbi:MAG: inosine/xanthosine triphosphatase [Methanobacterium sp. ERen5]|nr:MAG: inosine/xanthosine triphosphatase [Methanobacterium sp. ERen5]
MVVGSKNPVKVNATRNVLKRIYNDVTVSSLNVDSEIPDQPFGMDQTVNGAVNRAKNAFSNEFDLSVGIESGLIEVHHTLTGYIDIQWCAIFDGNQITIGASSGFEYPSTVIEQVLEGVEVGDVMDQVTGVDALGQKKGAVSHLSHGMLNRTENTEECVLTAMIPRMNPEIYF